MPPKKKPGKDKGSDEATLTRIAIVSSEKCKPKKCRQECKKSCPVVKLGKMCIEVGSTSKLAFIAEPLCIGTCEFCFFSLVCGLLFIWENMFLIVAYLVSLTHNYH